MSVVLQEIELENFKSYRGLHRIPLCSLFTAIVGPNGTGKSNLMDAISFALGEKTSSLRVKRLSELIYGASTNNPVSRTASVKLTFRQTDGLEIQFRRIVQGVSSSYTVSDKMVTAEAYATHLEKLGINVKAKNLLVFQGTVESIALKNPKERAQLFEEFSGSLALKEEYDQRKEDLDRAQEDTLVALQKKKSVSAERCAVKRDCEIAEEYQQQKRKLKDQQMLLALTQLYHTERERESLGLQLVEASAQLSDLEGRALVVDEQLKTKKRNRSAVHEELDEIDEAVSTLESQLNLQLPSLIQAKEKASLLTKKLTLAEKSLEQAVKADQERLDEIDQLEEALISARRLVAAQKAAASTSAFAFLNDQQVKEYHRLKEMAIRRSAADVEELDSLKREQNKDQNRLDNLLRIQTEARSKLQAKQEELAGIEKRMERLQESISSIDAALQKEQQLEIDLSRKVETAKKTAEHLQGKLEDIEKNLQEANLDINETSRAAKKQKTVADLSAMFDGVRGRVAHLVSPVHPRYQLAVTKVIGRYLNAIVTNTEETARHCIDYLKSHMIKPETFLPMDCIKPKPLKERLRDIDGPGNCKLLFDVLSFDRQLEPIVRYITSNAVVCETPEAAMQIAWNGGPGERYDAVALDGTFYRTSGMVSGGSRELEKSAACWTEHQLAALQRVKEKLTGELQEAGIAAREEHRLFELASQITVLQHRRQYAVTDLETTDQRAGNLRTDIEKLSLELETAGENVEEFGVAMATKQTNVAEIQARINEVENVVFDSFCRDVGLANIREYETNEPRSRRAHSEKLAELEFQEKRILNQLEFQKSRDTSYNVLRWEKNVKKDKADLQRARVELDNWSHTEELKKQLEELKTQKLAVKKSASLMDEELAKARQEVAKNSRAIQALKEIIVSLKCKIQQRKGERLTILKQCERDQIPIPKLNSSSGDTVLTSSASSSSQWTPSTVSGSPATQSCIETDERFLIDYCGLPESYKDLEDSEEVQRLIKRLTKRVEDYHQSIEQLQGLNLNAQQRYAQVCQRVADVGNEFDRVRENANKAQEAFDKVKAERQRLFMECFSHVAENISPIYKALARHSAAIALLTPTVAEEPYLGAIDFCCIVPGRSCCPLASLSGGQKTVASLALLFAMRSFKPAPFFVLDEIDAALDKTSIGKVAAYLREKALSNHLQSIAISLKEEFYGHADFLIGIAPERGRCLTSKVFKLSLVDYPLEADESEMELEDSITLE